MKQELKDHDMPRDEEIKAQQHISDEESQMNPEPIYGNPTHRGYGRLKDKAAIGMVETVETEGQFLSLMPKKGQM